MEARAEEFADLESQDTGKPRATLVDDEILLSVDQIRFFAGAARNLEGRSAGEYMKDHTSFIRREPIGVVGQVTPVELPAQHGGLEVRAGDRGRQHDRAEAVGHDPAVHAPPRRGHRRVRARRASST